MWFISLLLSIAVIIARGLIIKLFYGWFILSHWTSLPQLNVAACLGLSYFLLSLGAWNFGNISKDHENNTLDFLKINLISLFYVVILLISGFIVHSFM